MKQDLKKIALALIGLSLINLFPLNTRAEPDVRINATIQYGPRSVEELETFLDAEIEKLMEKYHVPGLMFSYVKGDTIMLNKGYGITNIETKKAINPETDSSLVGSVAKVLVTTAVMQQVDKGKVRLDEDVNTYLDFEIKNDFQEKITVKNLLQHTAGFEDYYMGMATKDKHKIITLQESVKNYQPKVVYTPGDIYNYSNYGYNLLGYVVERVTGQEFDQYVAENIFGPLEMEKSSFLKNKSTADLRDDELIKGYLYDSGKNTFTPEDDTGYWSGYPAGGMMSNTHDLGNFLMMYLNQGKFKDKVILTPESVNAVQEEVFTPHRDLLGQALGFTINEMNGHKTIEKSGDAMGWTGQVVFFPEYGQGFSYTYNTVVSGFNLDLQNALADKFFPDISKRQERYNMSQEDLKKFEGYYRYTRYNQSGLAKLMVAFSPPHNGFVQANDDGTLSVGVMFVKDTITYEPISKDSFQKVGEDILEGPNMKIDLGKKMAFRVDDKKGKPEYMFFTFEKIAMERIPWWQYGMYSIFSILFYTIMALLVVLYWPIGKLIKIVRKKDYTAQISKEQKFAGWFGGITAGSMVSFMAIMFTNFNEELRFGIPLILKIGLIVPTLSILAFGGLVYFVVQSWQKKYWKLSSRLIYSLFTFSVFIFMIFSWFYNLIGWKY